MGLSSIVRFRELGMGRLASSLQENEKTTHGAIVNG